LIAFEAASRGAEVTVVERDPGRARWIAEAARALALPVRVVTGDAAALAGTLGEFDGAYVDPPYADDPSALVVAVAPVCRRWLVVESRAGGGGPAAPAGFAAEPARRYGESVLRVYRRDGATG
jgi:16S rRNA (guanine966-N2)-methyltransferase